MLTPGYAGPSFEFSHNPRFEITFSEKLESTAHLVLISKRRLFNSERSFSQSIIRVNKQQVSHLSPSYKLSLIAERAQAETAQIQKVKTLKNIKAQERKTALVTKLQTKFARYEIRSRKKEIQINCLSWITLCCVAGAAAAIKRRIVYKQVRSR
jgi:hypothetical protein